MEPIITNLSSKKSGAPVIGISGSKPDSKSVRAMQARVREAGAIPLLLANHGARNPEKDIHKFDAAIVMGNNFDIDPHDYIDRYPQNDSRRQIHPKTKSVLSTQDSAARCAYEKRLIEAVLNAKMPLFSICGGMQMLNVLHGGTLHQHIPDLIGHDYHSANAGKDPASPVVSVTIVEGTLLAHIAATQSLYTPNFPPIVPTSGTVNSFHHQAVDGVGKELIASAFSAHYKQEDGTGSRLVEAIERSPDGKYKDQFVLGVQWHPEFLPDNPSAQRIINDVSAAASKYAKDNNRHHAPEEIQNENILSALPMLRELSNLSKSSSIDITSPKTPGGRNPTPGKSR